MVYHDAPATNYGIPRLKVGNARQDLLGQVLAAYPVQVGVAVARTHAGVGRQERHGKLHSWVELRRTAQTLLPVPLLEALNVGPPIQNAPGPLSKQAAGYLEGAPLIVKAHRDQLRFLRATVAGHKGQGVVDDHLAAVLFRRVSVGGDIDDAVGAPLQNALQKVGIRRAAGAEIEQHDPVALGLKAFPDALEQSAETGVGQGLFHGDADAVGAVVAQGAGGAVGDILQPLGCVQHRLAGRRRYLLGGVPAEDIGHGGMGNADFRGNVFDGGSSSHSRVPLSTSC